MSNHLVISNYISRCHTSYGVYHTYHSNVILFGSKELFQLIFPGLFHELKIHCKYPEMFNGTISAPSRYELPNYISPTKLVEQLRTDLADGMLFIHTWVEEHSNETTKQLLETNYDTYERFFETMLTFIIRTELDESVREIAIDIKTSIRKISSYLGPYHGNLRHSVINTKQFIEAIIVLVLFMYMFSDIKQDTNSSQLSRQAVIPVLEKTLDVE